MDIYQHFRKEEEPFIDKVLSWKEEVERYYQRKLTDFLDPREQQITEMLIGKNDDLVQISRYGGNPYCERCRVILAPFYETIQEEDFELVLLQATYPTKFITLSHRDVMGAFLSLGIKRQKLGDILVENGIIQLLTTSDIAPYIITNMTSIKKASITLEEEPLQNMMEKPVNWKESEKTVSSLRLDAIVKEIYHISRKAAAEYIQRGYIKVNFKMVEDTKFNLQAGDIISFRGKGRSKVVAINGKTKKDKWRITTAILI
ncbi:YlmH family RNA-binding protein [Oceanobacillus halotolerans]|uniref:YlmH family RNA-binding protein n=1 Tax=Oceanobacillus halotolerans TaxID=2663380 RepID=UPI0013D98F16|nr:RNA-binding protein [Oceanobacillus halotolerans]